MKWRGYCDAYSDAGGEGGSGDLTPPKAQLIHTKKAPLVIKEPASNTIRFQTKEQKAYFDEWSNLSVQFLGGGLHHARLWQKTMPQVTLEEPVLRYGAMAVGALLKAYQHAGQSVGTVLATSNKHYFNSMVYYCEALKMQASASPTREGLRTALMSSLLFICFETLRANMPVALKHIIHGFSMLNELAACTGRAPDLVSIAAAPPAMVEEILDCYKPLELQSRSFMGSYKKFFFSSNTQAPQSPVSIAGSDTDMASGTSRGTNGSISGGSPSAHSPSTSAESPGWAGQAGQTPPSQNTATGLPSPQSQASPSSQRRPITTPAQGASPQRPPGIMPFTRHSPYFRPVLSSITNLEELPRAFSSFNEAHGYWNLLQRQMVQYIPLLTITTTQLRLTRVTDDAELSAKLDSVKQNPQISKFIAESRYWLQRWSEAWEPLFQASVRNKDQDPISYLQVINLRIEYLILYIYTAIPRYSGLVTAKGLTAQYREINILSEKMLQSRPSCGFAMDLGWTWPLFISSFGCRDPDVRAEAARILDQYPVRNALRDSRIFRAIALRNEEAERHNAAFGDGEQDQWLRLRRRELVFEDFGTNIIFRSAQWDEGEGRWVLVEEVADHMVLEDGTLAWRRQPISEAASILSGVC